MKRDMNQNTMSGQKADIIIDKLAIGKINGMIYRDPMHECGGILLGNISQDVVTGKYTAHVCDLYEEERIGTSSTFEFTTDYLMNAVKYVKKNCPDMHIIGNIHSHAQYQAFWSGVDHEMMRQSRDNSVYMVVSPRYGTWEAIFKNIDFKFYECNMFVADAAVCEHMFAKCVTQNDEEYFVAGKKVKKSVFHTTRNYTETQKAEIDKRFLHSIQELAGKKVLIVGAGTIGNLLVEYAMNSGVNDGIESSSGVFVAKESLGNTPADRINNGALPYTNNAEFETTVELGRDQNLIIGEIAPQSKFSMMDPEQQPREGGAIQVVTDGGYQNGAVINRDAKFPAVIEQTEEKSESKDSAVQQEDMQMEKGKAPMENRSDFEESFLDAEQDVISTQDMDAGAMSDANTDGIGNE